MATPTSASVLAERYRVVRRLGAGGMATVFLAEDQRLGRPVAVKRMHADSPEDVARRFEREARLGASLNHPNVVGVFDIVTDPENVLIVMEYVEGETLGDALRRGPLPPVRAVEILRGVGAALDHAHAQGVVHRDVKPANVLLGKDGAVKLTDLGIATAAEGMTHITRTGTVLGTPAYMAPEQLEGGSITPAADVYALATLAFEMLAGRKARSGRTPVEIAHRVATEPPPDIRDVAPTVPPGTAEVLCQGMSRDPRDRPETAGELVDRLASALEDATIEMARPLAKPAGEEEPDGRAGAAAGFAAGAAAGAAAAAAGERWDAEPAEPEPADAAPAPAVATPAQTDAPTPVPEPPRAPAGEADAPEAPPRPARRTPAEGGRSSNGAAAPPRRDRPVPGRPRDEGGGRGRAAAIAAVLGLLLLAGAVLAVVGGGGEDPPEQAAQQPAERTPQPQPDPPSGGAQAPEEEAGGAGGAAEDAAAEDAQDDAAAGATGEPAAAVQEFYTRAANDDFDGAWALLSPEGKAVFGSQSRLAGTFDTLKSIQFTQADAGPTSGGTSQVSISTVATHTGFVDRCAGTVPTVRSGGRWLVSGFNVDCTRSSGGG